LSLFNVSLIDLLQIIQLKGDKHGWEFYMNISQRHVFLFKINIVQYQIIIFLPTIQVCLVWPFQVSSKFFATIYTFLCSFCSFWNDKHSFLSVEGPEFSLAQKRTNLQYTKRSNKIEDLCST